MCLSYTFSVYVFLSFFCFSFFSVYVCLCLCLYLSPSLPLSLSSTSLSLLLFIFFNSYFTFCYYCCTPLFHSLCLKLRRDTRFQHAFTACGCVFKEITLVWANKVITWKMQLHAVNACWKWLSQLSFSFNFSQSSTCLDWSAKVLLESTWNKIHKKTDTMTRR